MEKEVQVKTNGFTNLFISLILFLSPLLNIWFYEFIWLVVLFCLLSVLGVSLFFGLFTIQPNQTKVLVFFGKYKGTVKQNGFFWLNPFYQKIKVSLRVRNLETDIIKVNDELGNPILISAVVVWKIVNTYKAAFDIEALEETDNKTGIKKIKREESYQKFVKMQAEAALRKIAHSYPYDLMSDDDTQICLRSGVDEINRKLAEEIKERLQIAGIEVLEARISNLSYAPEIAAIMLQRQQAQAIIAARKKIVEGAVSMVEMALEQLSEKKVVDLTPENRASMVSNLLVVLCSEHAANPVLNAGLDKSLQK